MVALAPTTSTYLLGRAIAGVGLGAVFGAAFAYIRAVAKPGKLPAPSVSSLRSSASPRSSSRSSAAVSPASTGAWRSWWLPPCPGVLRAGAAGPAEGSACGRDLDRRPRTSAPHRRDHRLPLRRQRAWSQPDQPRTLLSLLAGAVIIGAFFVHESRDEHRFFREPVPLTHVPRCHLRRIHLQLRSGCRFPAGHQPLAVRKRLKTAQVALWQLPLTGPASSPR